MSAASTDPKLPPRKRAAKKNRRMSPAQWVEAEELYRQGWTQAQLSDRYKVRVETVSRHMSGKKIKGGERAEAVRGEVANALLRKQREFSEVKAQREIDAKDMLFKMNNVLLGAYAREFQQAMSTGKGLAALSASAKALKDSLMSLRLGREEIYAILEVKDGGAGAELPTLEVSSMTDEEEALLRSRVTDDDEEEEEDDVAQARAAAQLEDVIAAIDRQVEMPTDG